MAASSSGRPSARYAGVARYLESLEMAGGDLEIPQGHPVTYDDDDDDVSRPQRLATGSAAARPEVKDDDVTHRSDTSPGSRVRQQVDKII